MLTHTFSEPAGAQGEKPVLRARFEANLLIDGQAAERVRVLPLISAMLPAFAAYGRGTAFQADGPAIAVEDLWPGDRLVCADGDTVTVTALAQVGLTPAMLDAVDYMVLRVLPERFGPSRPERDLILGASAQLVQPGTKTQTLSAEDCLDHEMVLALTPPGATTLFQVICDRPAVLRANGVPVPSFDPASYGGAQGVLVREWLSFFFDARVAGHPPLRGPASVMMRRAMG